jgi:Holliday junction resolvase RusA-like endonuclease
MYFLYQKAKKPLWDREKPRNLKKTSPIHHTSTPDVDNLLKFVCDALNGYAWVDDSQIVIKYGEKVYAMDYPKTEITIEEIL